MSNITEHYKQHVNLLEDPIDEEAFWIAYRLECAGNQIHWFGDEQILWSCNEVTWVGDIQILHSGGKITWAGDAQILWNGDQLSWVGDTQTL